MPDQEQITLKISAAEIELYCDELCRGSSNISRKHASLIALEGFITRHASTDKYSGPYHTILNTIQQYSEQTRTQLLKAYADELEVALSNEEPRELARIHESMSRNGYDRILDSALTHHAPEQLQSLKAWAGRWCQKAEQRALDASGYPDAFDFKGAGIPLAEYRAMCELKRKLEPL